MHPRHSAFASLLLLGSLSASCGSGGTERDEGAPATPGESSAPNPTSAPPGEPAVGGSVAPASPGTTPPGTAMPTDTPASPAGSTGMLGTGVMGGSGQSSDRWQKADVTRSGGNYFFMANGWGPGFENQSVSWNGTSFIVEAMQGSRGDNYEPASYPTVFCGRYSSEQSQACGLPASLDTLTSIKTGWRWSPNGNEGEYNAAYDVWLGNNGGFGSYLMVWLRDPPRQQPAGTPGERDVTVANVPHTWDLWVGTVNNFPIVNYARPEGSDIFELEFDVMDFIRDAQQRELTLPATDVLAVAVGFEIWNGPVQNLESVDFYVDVQ